MINNLTFVSESKLENNENHVIANNVVKPSARQLVVKELLQTEINYVGILSTILNVSIA